MNNYQNAGGNRLWLVLASPIIFMAGLAVLIFAVGHEPVAAPKGTAREVAPVLREDRPMMVNEAMGICPGIETLKELEIAFAKHDGPWMLSLAAKGCTIIQPGADVTYIEHEGFMSDFARVRAGGFSGWVYERKLRNK